jgi:signal transduction histidine kinase
MASIVGLNSLAIWGLFAARDGARRMAMEDLALQTRLHAHALEAVLATLRADLTFLTQAPPLARAPEVYGSSDPVTRRWGRLDVEGTLLLFLEAQPAVERLWLLDGDGRLEAAAGRRGGAPVLLRRDEIAAPAPPELLHGRFPLPSAAGEGWTLEAWSNPDLLLRAAAPGLADHLELDRGGTPAAARAGWVSVAAPVMASAWQPPLAWRLVRREPADRLVQSFATVADRYRVTLLLNLGLVVLALLLGGLALRQVRRAARLAAEARHAEERRELERLVQHSDRLASVGRLAAGIAHEINNPLEGMANYLALLDEDLARGDTREASLLASRLHEGLDRAAAIVRQVLAFADPGRAPKQPLDLRQLVERTLGFVRANPEFRHLEIAALGAPDDPVPVLGNATTLGQLALNLLINACQAQPGGGRVETRLETAGDRARLTIDDWGPGLPPETLAHLFEPFYSTRGTTGLGLAVCHGIVGDHGGTLAAVNRPEGGARFVVALPLDAEAVEAAR